jgi:hypothetical protein
MLAVLVRSYSLGRDWLINEVRFVLRPTSIPNFEL